ncbi:MAG TPA: alkaline phosphatase family protein [Ktedonobacterales bacterium]|nr:alkaline phosphatase family protein [Ktedonobacterales bacterium]
MKRFLKLLPWGLTALVLLIGSTAAAVTLASAHSGNTGDDHDGQPIQHLVVIFQENVSFDHYFGTYPNAANPKGEPAFYAFPGTPVPNGLTPTLLNDNPNLDNPQRLDRSQAITCDQDHGYTDEQKAFDGGLADQFVQHTAGAGCTDKSVVMDYYDGNTVTALWNYAQFFSMSDNSFDTEFGPSTPGALNLISGQTNGATVTGTSKNVVNGTVIGDLDPTFDDCSAGATAAMSGVNIGDLLNAAHLTWGWFEGGFAPSAVTNGVAACKTAHTNVGGASISDYIAHHEPFQYYASTSNPHHLPPSSIAMIGHTDQANHQYDLTNFWQAANHNNLPAVSFLKAPAFEDGHAGYSDPLDEQNFLVNTINALEKLPSWRHTAVIINYDDSDGWYDHVMPPIVNQSNDPTVDALNGASCGANTNGHSTLGGIEDRCGYGVRLPMMVISPWAKQNYIDHTLTDQTSIIRFIEDNWLHSERISATSFDNIAGSLTGMFDFRHGPRGIDLRLNPTTGEVSHY